MSKLSRARGPLRQVVLAATGQDVAKCTNCGDCEDLPIPDKDLTVGEMFQFAARDDESALASRTLWACDGAIEGIVCQARLDLAAVVAILRREAGLRGVAPSPNGSRVKEGGQSTVDG
ncbi:MAG TPA: hypothetical protein VJ123_09850 [Anaerolineales bacterium]|nr:hypothetical protein [Anaerolineales bacterium]